MNIISTFLNKQLGYQQIDKSSSNSAVVSNTGTENYEEAAPLAACRSGDVRRLRSELSKDPNAIYREFRSGKTGVMTTLLQVASQEGHLELCRTVLEMGANVNYDAYQGVTALFIASQNGHLDIVKDLLTKGADPNKPRNDGCTPLLIASQNNHRKIVEHLLSRGADPNNTTSNGATPLYIASAKGHCETVQLLLESGANINSSCSNGNTALFIASLNGHLDTVNQLLAATSDPTKQWTVQLPDTRSALLAAERKQHPEVAARLKSAIDENR